MPDIESRLQELRQKRGLSAIKLAAAAGVSRQTIYAMEAGAFVPNTAVALRLARALESAVEDLFVLPGDDQEARPGLEEVTLLPDCAPPQEGDAVQLCRVHRKLMASARSATAWYFPPADAVVAGKSGRGGKTTVQVFEGGDFSSRILMAGCDPGISVLSRHAQGAGVELVSVHRNSSEAMALLKQGCVHVAGTHLRDAGGEGSSNLPEIHRLFAADSVAVITFAVWEEGILTANGNPKKVNGIGDLSRRDIGIVNREQGSGSRALLDFELERAGINSTEVRGYRELAFGHLPAAWQVRSGAADCCVATRGAARLFRLHFIPFVSERYDLVLRKRDLALPRIQHLFDTLSRSGFRRELEGIGGYDMRRSGERIL